jgi:aldehyde:ferredoxin oxidoreductase
MITAQNSGGITMYGFMGKILVVDLGLDTISTGNMIAWLMNCFENNVIVEDNLGYSIDFGDGQNL